MIPNDDFAGWEEAAMGSVLLLPDRAHEAIALAGHEDFYEPKRAKAWLVIEALVAAGVTPTFPAVVTEASARGLLDELGGPRGLVEWSEAVCYGPHASKLVTQAPRAVAELAIRRKAASATAELSTALGKPSQVMNSTPVSEMVMSIADVAAAAEADLLPAPSWTALLSDVLLELTEPGRRPEAVKTGFYDLDRMLSGGMTPGALVVLAARPSIGKSTIAAGIALEAAKAAHRVGFVSVETATKDLLAGMVRNLASVQVGDREPSDGEVSALTAAASRLSALPLAITDRCHSLPAVVSQVRTWHRQHRLGLIVVDYMQLLTVGAGKRDSTRQQDVAEISRTLKLLAVECQCPVLALSQLSRAVESRDGRRPRLSDLRDSGAIEQDADVVLLIHRADDDGKLSYETELLVAKNRHGPVGNVRLVFQSAYVRFVSRAHAP